MGKKSKKKCGKPSKAANSSATQGGTTQSKKKKPHVDSDQVSLYRIYKYCTDAVIQWGKSTYSKTFKKKAPKNTTSSYSQNSLSHAIFDILTNLAEEGTLMPQPVLDDLRLAISYRKKVSKVYQVLPQVSDEDYARHEWLIQQLEILDKAFRTNQKLKQGESTTDLDPESNVREGFEVLALSDDDESVASNEDEDDSKLAPKTKVVFETPPSTEELEQEELMFAISLFLYEMDTIRDSLRDRWRKWAQKAAVASDTDEKASNLLAVTASTEYAMSAARKSLLQMSLEIRNFPDIGQLIQLMGNINYKGRSSLEQVLKEADLVTIHSLQNRSELNGKEGVIASPVEPFAERVPVKVFSSGKTLSVKPENLFLSDSTHRRLQQIHRTMAPLDLERMDIPEPPALTYRSPPSKSVQKAGVEIIYQGDKFASAASLSDFQSFLDLTVKHSLPVWISLARYLPDAGAADAVFNAYIRDYAKSEALKFPLAFALLIAIDGSMECQRANADLCEDTLNAVVVTVESLFSSAIYSAAVRLLQEDGRKADALYAHIELTQHMCNEYQIGAMVYPWIAGEYLLSGLRMHFVCGTGLPYANVGKYTNILHIYWVLRSEGYLGKIPDLEAMISIYWQQVFFRGGLAKKGEESYMKCQQLANGVSTQMMRQLDGTGRPGRSNKTVLNADAFGMDGLHVAEISRLLDILQWKSMPIIDKETCFNEIESIAQEEFSKVLTTPLLDVSVKLSKIGRHLELHMTRKARESGERMMDNFAILTSRMTPIDLVSFWTTALGDNRSIVPREKEQVLTELAQIFAGTFRGRFPVIPGEEPTLAFGSNEHKVDPALWGEKAARMLENRHIS